MRTYKRGVFMKWKNIGTHKEFVEDFVQFFEENNIIHGEPFECGGTAAFPIWQVPYMAIGEKQMKQVDVFLEQRIKEDRV